jgi:hypothetical protein
VSAADKRRRRRRAAAQRAVKLPSEPFERTTFGGKAAHESGNVETQWKPGEAPNPLGYSKGRRIGDAIHRLITTADLEDKIASTVVTMALGVRGERPADLGWFRELRDMVDGKVPRITVLVRPADDVVVNVATAVVVETNVHGIDPAVAERIMAAAEPGVTIDEEPEDETT